MNRAELLKALRDTAQSASNAIASNVSGPVDLIAAALRAGGLDIQQPVGGSEWMQKKGLTAPVEMGAPRIIGETLGMAGPAVVAAKAPQIAAGLNQAGANIAAPRTLHPQKGAIVWHGSPHKFDKFDSSKIGTGEGNQAYGHGLYLAESQDVAKTYQNLKPITDQTDGGFIQARAAFDIGKGNVKKALKWLDDRASSVQKNAQFLTDGGASEISQIERARELLKSGALQPGNMYRVDLPDEQIAKMLDWDKPLSQQSKEVQRAIAKTKTMLPPNAMDDLGGDLSLMYGPDVTPKDFLNTWESFGQKAGGEAALKKLGVPGIRYLDGGSRGTGQGTSNFVVFPGNESMLKIIERNGQPLGLMGVK